MSSVRGADGDPGGQRTHVIIFTQLSNSWNPAFSYCGVVIATVASLMGEDELTCGGDGLLGINTQSVVIPSFSFLPGLVFPGGRIV